MFTKVTDNDFMTYASKIVMLDSLNLYSAACQLYLNETGREKNQSIGYLHKDHYLLQVLALVVLLSFNYSREKICYLNS